MLSFFLLFVPLFVRCFPTIEGLFKTNYGRKIWFEIFLSENHSHLIWFLIPLFSQFNNKRRLFFRLDSRNRTNLSLIPPFKKATVYRIILKQERYFKTHCLFLYAYWDVVWIRLSDLDFFLTLWFWIVQYGSHQLNWRCSASAFKPKILWIFPKKAELVNIQ